MSGRYDYVTFFAIVGGASFGAWQDSAAAGVFMWMILTLVILKVEPPK